MPRRTVAPLTNVIREGGNIREALVRPVLRSVLAGITALAVGLVVKSGPTPADPADAGLGGERRSISVFGTIHPKIFDLRPPLGSQMPALLDERVASLATDAVEEEETQAESPILATHSSSFEERFASSFGERSREEDESLVFGPPVAPMPLTSALPPEVRSFVPRSQVHANNVSPTDSMGHETATPEVSQPALESATATRPRLPAASNESVGAAETRNEPIAPPESGSRTAIYDIAAHAVYLPNGDRLEAHSGLGGNLDNPHYVNLKSRGPTPPNVYDLALRKQPFHGVRAIRLIPVGQGNMFGRDGILAHSYMLGPNGQSNGCVSFSNYSAFLNAFLKGEVDRLIVVERLATAPTPKGSSGWLPEALRNLFKSS